MIYLIEASVCMTTLFGLYFLLLRRDSFFQRNRIYLLSSLVVSLIIPALEFNMSPVAENYIPVVINNMDVTAIVTDTAHVQSAEINYWNIIFWIGAIVSALFFTYRVGRIVSFIRVLPIGKINGFSVRFTNGSLPTSSFFNQIFWNNNIQLSKEEELAILRHEHAHTDQWHTADLIFLEMMAIIFWFNPVIHLYRWALREQHEFLADDAAANIVGINTYQKVIVGQLFKQLDLGMVSSFGTSPIKKRINMLNKQSNNIMKILKPLITIPVLAILFFTYSCTDTDLQPSDKVEVGENLFLSKTIIKEEGKQYVIGTLSDTDGNPMRGMIFLNNRKFATVTKEDGSFKIPYEANDSYNAIKLGPKQDMAIPDGNKLNISYKKAAIDGGYTLKGTVTNEKGEAIPGTNVIIKGTTTGTVTNFEGRFSISVPDNGNLVFSMIKYPSETIQW